MLKTFGSNGVKKPAESFMSLGGTASIPIAFLGPCSMEGPIK